MSNATDNPSVEVLKAGGSGVFTNYIYKAIPLAFDESMSYYETLAGLRDYLEETVIPTVNNNVDAVAELQSLYEELNEYVDNYFKNLDVQEEINNKLDDLVEDGTLTRLIGEYVQPLIDEQNQEISEFKSQVNGQIVQQNEQIRAVASGSPLVASNVQGMTDTTRVYVNTADGYWYYYNGSQWVQGGIYQSTVVDEYITTGIDLVNKTYKVENQSQYPQFLIGGFNIDTGNTTTATNRCRTGRFISSQRGLVFKVIANGWKLRIGYYNSLDSSWTDSYIKGIDFTKEYVNALDVEDSYICLCLSKDDDSAITTEDLVSANNGEILQITYLTDKELKVYEAPADSKTVGNLYKELIRNNNNKIQTKNLFLNSGINQYTGNNEGNTLNRHRTGRLLPSEIGTVIKLNNPNYLMRAFYYNSGTDPWLSSYLKANTNWSNEIIIDPGYPYFALEFKNLTNTDLDSTDADNIKNSLLSYMLTDNTMTKANVPADAKAVGDLINTGIKRLKILGIGNSYTRDCLRWVSKILLDLNYIDVIVGHGYIGGITLQEQYESLNSADESHNAFEYYKYDNSVQPVITSNKSLDEIFADEDWDVVIFQQQSDDAGQYNTFVNSNFDINDFITYIKSHINNNNLKIGINATWSHNAEYSSSKFIEYYDRNPELQYNAIQSNIPNVANHMSQCDFVINTGLAVKIARGHNFIKDIGNHLLRTDNNHLDYGIPEFMCGYCYLKAITDICSSDINWYPTSADSSNITQSSAYLAYLAKQIADYSNNFSQIYSDIQ